MSGQKIINGLNDALEGLGAERVVHVRLASYPTPEEVVQSVLMLAYGADYKGPVTSPVRRQAQKITNALRRYGWRIIR